MIITAKEYKEITALSPSRGFESLNESNDNRVLVDCKPLLHEVAFDVGLRRLLVLQNSEPSFDSFDGIERLTEGETVDACYVYNGVRQMQALYNVYSVKQIINDGYVRLLTELRDVRGPGV